MALSTSANKVIHSGNGVATSFAYTFPILEASHLSVIYTDTGGNAVTLASSLYSVTGIGGLTGGTVTYPLSGPELATGETLTILRTVPLTQTTVFSNQGGYYPEVVEGRFDRVYMALQQLQEQLGRVDLDQPSATGAHVVPTLADLKALAVRYESVLVKSGQAAGVWQWVADSATTADDGIVVECTDGPAGRYKRVFSGPVYVEWYGALGYPASSDDSTAFAAALASGYNVQCQGYKTYYVKDQVVGTEKSIDGNWSAVRAASSAKWIFRLSGFGCRIARLTLDDANDAVVRSTTLSAGVTATATIFTVASADGLEVGMLATVYMDNARWHISPITGIAGTTIAVARAFNANATSGAEVACSWGMLNIRGSSMSTFGPARWSNTSFGIVMDADPAAGLPYINNRNTVDLLNMDSVKHVGVFRGRNCADNGLGRIVLRSGVTETNSYTGDGVTAAFNLSHAAWLKSDVTVTVSGLVKTIVTDYTFNSRSQIQFTGGNVPTNGQTVSIANVRDGKAGYVEDATGWSGIRGGDTVDHIQAVDFVRGVEGHTLELMEKTVATVDTCSGEGIYINACSGAGPVGFGKTFAGYCHAPIKIDGNSTAFSHDGALWTTRPAISATIAGTVGSYDIEVESGSTAYIDTTGWHPSSGKTTGGSGTFVFSGAELMRFGSSSSFVAAGVSTFYGPGGHSSAGNTGFVLDRARTIRRLYVLNGASPGVGQTYTVAVQVDGIVSVVFTGTIVAGAFSLDIKGIQTVAANATIYIKVTGSEAAATTTFRGYVELV